MFVTERAGSPSAESAIALPPRWADFGAGDRDGGHVVLSGDPLAGETWRLRIDGTTLHAVTVGGSVDLGGGQSLAIDSLEHIARGSLRINARRRPDRAAGGSTLVLASRGTAFTVVFERVLAAPSARWRARRR